MPKITAFGEILWDNLPTGKVLGGAPVNLLTHLAALGADCSVISRCGNDADGDEGKSHGDAQEASPQPSGKRRWGVHEHAFLRGDREGNQLPH